MPLDQLKGRKTSVEIDIISNGQRIDQVETNFMGPGSLEK